MSYKSGVNLDLNNFSLLNPVFNPLAAAPEHANTYYYYTSTASADKGTLYCNVGTFETPVWKAIGVVQSVNGKTGVVVLTQDDVGDGTTYKRTHNDLTDALVTLINGAIQSTEKGAANGVASLDGSGKVPSAQLPSYVDDVVEGYLYNGAFYEDAAHTTQITPSTGKIYVDLTSEKAYRWSGSVYVEISQGTIITRTTGTIGTSATSATVSYSGTLINAYATQGGAEILLDIVYGSGTVTFTVAAAPSSEITCVVISC